jgi:hypothetical protein
VALDPGADPLPLFEEPGDSFFPLRGDLGASYATELDPDHLVDESSPPDLCER